MEITRCSDEVQLDVNSLLHVFSLLHTRDKQNVAQVCQYWKDLVYLPCLWKNVRVVLHHCLDYSLITSLQLRRITRFVCRGTKDKDLALLFATIPDVISLDIHECRHVSQQFLQDNLSKLNKLESLHITRCHQINLESLYQESSLTNVLGCLKSITLPDYKCMSSFQKLIKKFPSLEDAIDAGIVVPLNDSDDYLNCVVESCPKLRCLELLWFSKECWKAALERLDLKAICLREWDNDIGHIKLLGDILPNLESLSISFLDFYIEEYLIDGIVYAVKRLRNLKHFDIGRFLPLSRQNDVYRRKKRELFKEISKMAKLESLKLDCNADELSGATIYSIVENMPNLQSLEIGPVGNISAEYANLIGDRLTNLRSLKVIIDNKRLDTFTTGIGNLCSKLPNLIDINIIHDDLFNEDLKEIACGPLPSKLKSLNIAGSTKIKDQGLNYIANGLKSLSSLDISSCSVSDAGLSLIADNLHYLQSLSLTGRKVTDHGGIMIGKHLNNLEKLEISGTKIGDQGFAFICNHLPKLHTLQAFCDLVTDQGFLEGAVRLKRLKTLQFGSHRIHIEAIEESLKHLDSVMHLTLRSISVTQACIESIVKELSCLSKLGIYCCLHSTQHFNYDVSRRSRDLCKANGIKFETRDVSCLIKKSN